jgi:hypothetical protein
MSTLGICITNSVAAEISRATQLALASKRIFVSEATRASK